MLPDGEEGELVFTSLTKQAMPVIRYRTRDLTRLLPGTARTMRRIEKITGRTDDMIILRGVNLFPTQIEELILRTPGAVAALPVRARPRRGRLDALTVRSSGARTLRRRRDRGRRPAPAPGEEHHRRHRDVDVVDAGTASSGRSARCAASSTTAPASHRRRWLRKAAQQPSRNPATDQRTRHRVS